MVSAVQKPGKENFDPKAIEEFRARFRAAIEWGQQNNIPLQIMEGTARDLVGSVEAIRLLQSLRGNGARL